MHWILSRNVLFVFFAVLQIYECKKKIPENPRSVNLALETVLQFDKNENSADIQIIDKVQRFLDQVKHVIKKNRNARRFNSDNFDEPLTFTEFIKSVLLVLSTYDDNDLENVASVIDEELRKYHYKGCKFYELIEHSEVREYLAQLLQDFTAKPGKELKRQLKDVVRKLTDENRGFKQRLISRYLDSLYTVEDATKFNHFLSLIALYKRKTKRAELELSKIIRGGLRNVLFDHYTKLDKDTRRDLRIKIESFWKDFTSNRQRHDVLKLEITTSKVTNDYREKIRLLNSGSLERHKPKKYPPIKKSHKREKFVMTTKRDDFPEGAEATRLQKYSFITLYPETITSKHHKDDHGHKNKGSRQSTLLDSRRVTAYRSKPLKSLIYDTNIKIDVKHDRYKTADKETVTSKEKSSRVEHKKHPKKLRFHVIRRVPDKTTTMKVNSNYRTLRARKSASEESLEGLQIEGQEDSDEISIAHYNVLRKSNDNDALINRLNGTNITFNSDFIERITRLETELKDVKEKIEKNRIGLNLKERSEEQHYDMLDFWENTKTSRIGNSTKTSENTTSTHKTTKTVTKTMTSATTTTTAETTTTPKPTTAKKMYATHLLHRKRKHEKKKIHFTSERYFTTTNTIVDKPVLRGRDSDENENEIENNEIQPTATENTQVFDVVNLKSSESKTLDLTSITTEALTSTDKIDTTTAKPVNNTKTTKKVVVEDFKDYSSKLEIDTYLNDTLMLEDDTKQEMVKQKMKDDLKKLMPSQSETRDTLGTPTEALSVDKIATAGDTLALLDDGDDLLRK